MYLHLLYQAHPVPSRNSEDDGFTIILNYWHFLGLTKRKKEFNQKQLDRMFKTGKMPGYLIQPSSAPIPPLSVRTSGYFSYEVQGKGDILSFACYDTVCTLGMKEKTKQEIHLLKVSETKEEADEVAYEFFHHPFPFERIRYKDSIASVHWKGWRPKIQLPILDGKVR